MLAGAAHTGISEFDFHCSLGPGKHTRYVPPLVNPLFNETPYMTTEARPAYLHYDIPESFLTTGGTIDVYALELRLALTERLGIIASKDGYADADSDAVLTDEDGFANISIGLKYAVHSDPSRQSIVSVGLEYEPAERRSRDFGDQPAGPGARLRRCVRERRQGVGAARHSRQCRRQLRPRFGQ